MKSISKRNKYIYWNNKYLWEESASLALDSIIQTIKTEKISNNYRINIYLVDQVEIKKLNYKFLNKNYATDVLSFNYYNGWKNGIPPDILEIFPDEENKDDLGEIFICVPIILKQAEENNHSFAKEMSTMAIHGTLHLLGYNHEKKNEEKIMFSKTEMIIKLLNLGT